MQRIAIMGPCGAGKSTLAIRLGERTGIPVFHLDQMFWKPGWVEAQRDELVARVEQVIRTHDRWIIDGNYGSTLEQRLAAADTVVYLDLPPRVYRWRILKRVITGYGRTRRDMAPQCPERFDLEFTRYVLAYHRRHRPHHLARLEPYRDSTRIIMLRSPREVRGFLDGV